MSTTRTFKIGINEKIIDKPEDVKVLNPAKDWQNLDLTDEELVSQIENGHAFSAHYRKGYRRTLNFICSDFIAADIDGSMSIEAALESVFVKRFASFLYTTPSHTEDRHRFRIVFLLEETIHHSEDWKNSLLGLAVKVGGDLSIKDAGRMFYGNRHAKIHKLGNLLSKKEVHTLINAGVDERARSHKKVKGTPMRSSITIGDGELVRTSSGAWASIGELPAHSSVFCQFHIDTHPSAFVVKSLSGSSIGIHCMTCNTTFWSGEPGGYDFDAFDRLALERTAIDQERVTQHAVSADFLEQYFPPSPSLEVIGERYLPKLAYRPGITMVKSPKGSGKTEALKGLLAQIRANEFAPDLAPKNRPVAVLLVGHRQSLIKEAANKLGLACYLDTNGYEEVKQGFATCLDSLHKVTESTLANGRRSVGRPVKYDVLILDESEQVFTHLTGDTLAKNKNTYRAFLALQKVVRDAKAVYALDADLGLITAHALRAMRYNDWRDRCRVILNKPAQVKEQRRVMSLYQKRADIEIKLIDALKKGERCFVVSNSKKAVDTLEELVVNECGDKIQRRKITSDNSSNPDEREFVLKLTAEFVKIQVLLCSPSLGTGIDITFPNGERKVDHVFGFFYSFINTHTDIDQQLARVRNPGEVSVWFDSNRYRYETNFDVIRDDLGRGYWVEAAVKDVGEDGKVDYDKNHPLLLIWSHVVCAQRASKNKIVQLFKLLRAANGWDVQVVEDVTAAEPRNSSWREAAGSVKQRRIDGILSAKDLSDDDVIDLYESKRRGEKLTDEQLYRLERGRLRMAFNVPVNRELIEMNDDGRLVERVKSFRLATDHHIANSLTETIEGLRAGNGEQRLRKMAAGQLAFVVMSFAGLIHGTKIDDAVRLMSDDLGEFVGVCRANRTVIEELVGFALRGDMEKKPVRQLNELLQLIGLEFVPSARKRSGGKIVREYALDLKALELMRSLAANFKDPDQSAAGRRAARV